jgi:DNA-binding beta-propeller fold protein YncE
MKLIALALAFILLEPAMSSAETAPPLALDGKIALGAVRGRIDHMATDAAHRRLFVAELGNDSVGIVDLASGMLLRRITGLGEPQGVGYESRTETLYVANARDGSVRFFEHETLTPAGRLDLGSDADNVRIADGSVFVGHSSGALAIIDAQRRQKIADIPLHAHPESFRLSGDRIFVNLPDAQEIAVIDRASRKQVATWRYPAAAANFPMAIDEAGRRVAVVFRRPAALVIFDAQDGRVATKAQTCGDADDVFFDDKRRRVYVSCGEGFIDVFALETELSTLGRIATASGARTSLFVPERDRLFLAVRATGNEPAAIWVFRPTP